MKLTNFKNYSYFLLILLFACNPCEDGTGNDKNKNYIFYQANSSDKSLIFRFDYENFLIKEVSEKFELGESSHKEKIITFNDDSVLIYDVFSLESFLVLDNVPGLSIKNCFLNSTGNIFAVRSKENELYKSDLSSNLEFLKSNLLNYKCTLFGDKVYFWTSGNKFTLNSINIQNSNELSINLNLSKNNISDLSANEDNIVFSNYDNISSKIYILSNNLQVIDTSKTIDRPDTKVVLLNKDIVYYDKTKIYSENDEVLFESIDETILNIEYNNKLNIVFLYVENNSTNEKSIYYAKYQDNGKIENLLLLINKAEKAN